jgi:hypothetical protein
MIELKPDDRGFKAPVQREVLVGLSRNREISERFFLTGGTALSAFYLGHRVSEDLDLFSYEQQDLDEIDFWISKTWPRDTIPMRRSSGYYAVLIRDVKVDIVYDPLAAPGIRERADLGAGQTIAIDTIDNIASNKLTTLVSRTELKDFIDFYYIRRRFPQLEMSTIYNGARAKDVQFDDPASAAYQIELGADEMRRIISAGSAGLKAKQIPSLLGSIEWDDFRRLFAGLTEWIYAQGR